MNTLTAEEARRLLLYDPDTGQLFWRVSRRGGVRAGDPTGCPNAKGYLQTRINGTLHYVHRLVWLIVTGEWPRTAQIDHKNEDKGDCRWLNLREATNQQNQGNKTRHANNTSGIKGVGFDEERQRWTAYITINNKKKSLGRFVTKAEAASAYRAAAVDHFGEFARAA